MKLRIRQLLAVPLVALGAQACDSDQRLVLVSVKDDGRSCVVQDDIAPCAVLATFLVENLGVSLRTAIAVSSEGCGEDALARARAVGAQLSEAGFNQVAVVGFMSEPKAECAP